MSSSGRGSALDVATPRHRVRLIGALVAGLSVLTLGGAPGSAAAVPSTGSIEGAVQVGGAADFSCVTVEGLDVDLFDWDCFGDGDRYVFADLPVGSYLVGAWGEDDLTDQRTVTRFWPGTERRSQAGVVEVVAAESTVVELDLSDLPIRGSQYPGYDLALSSMAPVVGEPLTVVFTLTGQGSLPTGVVALFDAHGFLGDVEAVDGRATFVVVPDVPGPSWYQAIYDGDATFSPVFSTQEVVVGLAPVLVEPPSGSRLGGTDVVLTASGAGAATSVTFDGVPGTDLEVLTDDAVVVTAPPGATGRVTVAIDGPGGQIASGSYAYTDIVTQTPERVLADRSVTPGVVTCVDVAGVAGVPSQATGVLMNVTTVGPNGAGYVVVYPDSAGNGATAPPNGSTVNFEPGRDVANATIVALPANGKVCYRSAGATRVGVLMDVTGYTLPGSGLVAQTPTRLVDSRSSDVSQTQVGWIRQVLQPRTERTMVVPLFGGVPANAQAAWLNVVAVKGGVGNLRLYPTGQSLPTTSVVNYAGGPDKANGTITAWGASGRVSVWSDASQGVDVVADVVGYVVDSATYTATAPTRLVDTRSGAGHLGPIGGALDPRQVYPVPVAGIGPVPSDATAVVLNVTAIGPTGLGNLRVYPDDDGTAMTLPPEASTINYIPGRDIPNQVVVALPADGIVDFYSDMYAGQVHLAVDVVGYVAGG